MNPFLCFLRRYSQARGVARTRDDISIWCWDRTNVSPDVDPIKGWPYINYAHSFKTIECTLKVRMGLLHRVIRGEVVSRQCESRHRAAVQQITQSSPPVVRCVAGCTDTYKRRPILSSIVKRERADASHERLYVMGARGKGTLAVKGTEDGLVLSCVCRDRHWGILRRNFGSDLRLGDAVII
jgi:hypothetical protein